MWLTPSPSNKRTIRLEGQIIFTDEGRITTIDGGNAGVTVSGNNQTRVFYVNGGAKLDVNDLTVSGANAAAGSGIYNRRGEVNITEHHGFHHSR